MGLNKYLHQYRALRIRMSVSHIPHVEQTIPWVLWVTIQKNDRTSLFQNQFSLAPHPPR